MPGAYHRGDQATSADRGGAPRAAPPYRLDTVLLLPFVTQTRSPSKTTRRGLRPTGTVSSKAPSSARSLATVLSAVFTTQMLVPSKATPCGWMPAENVPSDAPSLARSL